MRWVDVSIPMRVGMAVWPGDDPFVFEPDSRIQHGAHCNTSRVAFGTHTGTHCDAPWHFEDEGNRLDEVDFSVFFGRAQVIELMGLDLIRAEDLPQGRLLDRVLFKTRNGAYSTGEPFQKDFVALDQSAAQRLVDEGVRLVGIDYLSIAPFGNSDPTHHTLLRHNVFVVEGLQLQGIPAGAHEFVVLPMPLAGADGAPCRAFVGLDT
ncbi:MAG: cyclase family protein [Candidatus Hydrogenedentes bacterium]|nr:cyclase family protein [Candidatus Hydrogenedentota bacterium]